MFYPIFDDVKHNKCMATLKIVLRKDKTNKRGECPIHFRITKDRKPRYISSGIMVPEQSWDEKNTRVRPSLQNSARLNALLSTKFAEVQAGFLELETVDRSMTASQIRDRVNGKPPVSFFELAEKRLKRYLDLGKVATYKDRKGMVTKLGRFLGNRNASFTDITPNVVERYMEHLRTIGNSNNTIIHNLKFIKATYNEALRLELIDYNHNPFRKIRFHLDKVSKCFLTEQELEAMAGVDLSNHPRLQLYRDIFLFASETCGIRISDMLQLRWEKFDGSHISFTVRKTGGQMSLKVPNRSIAIMEKYKRDSGYIFPILEDDIDTSDLELVHYTIQKSTMKINKGLKAIAKMAGISKNVTTHIGRHTWATRALRKGIPVEKVSKLMGHSKIELTLEYAKIVNSDLDRAMEVFNL